MRDSQVQMAASILELDAVTVCDRHDSCTRTQAGLEVRFNLSLDVFNK
jgi:hypothetical protein